MIWAIWFRNLFFILASRRSGFDHKVVHLKFVMDKLATEQICVRLLVPPPPKYRSTNATYTLRYGSPTFHKLSSWQLHSIAHLK